MKKRIIKWLEHLFGIDTLKQDLLQSHQRWFEEHKKDFERINKMTRLLEDARVASDIAFNGDRSWAVICLGGHKDTVYFYQLPDKNIKEIQEFLKLMQPDPRKRLIDCPYGMDYRFRGL
jgi:hypothetical protein